MSFYDTHEKRDVMKLRNHFLLNLVLLILLLSAVTACADSEDVPAQIIERYHQALVEKDQERMLNLSCSAWETMALMELDSFMSVETKLVDLTCQSVSSDDSSAKVTCEGAISATYDGEAREFPLDIQTFLVIQEGGEWRMCGYE